MKVAERAPGGTDAESGNNQQRAVSGRLHSAQADNVTAQLDRTDAGTALKPMMSGVTTEGGQYRNHADRTAGRRGLNRLSGWRGAQRIGEVDGSPGRRSRYRYREELFRAVLDDVGIRPAATVRNDVESLGFPCTIGTYPAAMAAAPALAEISTMSDGE